MSFYLVKPKGQEWGNWLEMAEKAGVEVSSEQQKLGDEIFSNKANLVPEPVPVTLSVAEHFSMSCPSDWDKLRFDSSASAHPFQILTLMSGMPHPSDEKIHQRWTYFHLASGLLLAHPSGKIYTFFLTCGKINSSKELSKAKWQVKFLPAGKSIPRSMYANIPSESYKRIYEINSAFVLKENGKYGQYYSSI